MNKREAKQLARALCAIVLRSTLEGGWEIEHWTDEDPDSADSQRLAAAIYEVSDDLERGLPTELLQRLYDA
jgi:hypothetical protein